MCGSIVKQADDKQKIRHLMSGFTTTRMTLYTQKGGV